LLLGSFAKGEKWRASLLRVALTPSLYTEPPYVPDPEP